MNVVDSSGWLEYVADGGGADFFADAIEDTPGLVVPSITIFEVFKRVLQQRGAAPAFETAALMRRGRVLDLDAETAIAAAQLSAELKLPLADSVILTTARRAEAVLWTQDSDFDGIDGVRYRHKE